MVSSEHLELVLDQKAALSAGPQLEGEVCRRQTRNLPADIAHPYHVDRAGFQAARMNRTGWKIGAREDLRCTTSAWSGKDEQLARLDHEPTIRWPGSGMRP